MDAKTRYETNLTKAKAELAKIGSLLDAHQSEAAKVPGDRGFTGDLSYVLGQLTDLREFLGGEDGVGDDSACPGCGESRADWLVWQDDETVRCGSCRTAYQP